MTTKQWQRVWMAVWLLAACIIVVFETGLLPEGVLCGFDSVQYALDICTMALTLAGIVTGMKAAQRPLLRCLCFAVPLVLALLVYFLFLSSTTLACAAAVAVAMLLMWPRANTPVV